MGRNNSALMNFPGAVDATAAHAALFGADREYLEEHPYAPECG